MRGKGSKQMKAVPVNHKVEPGQKKDANDRMAEQSGFLVGPESESESAEGNDTRMEIRYSEYRAVDGLQYPHLQRIKIVAAGKEGEFGMKVKAVKHNETFEGSIFCKPSA
jgi:hypothetical protein